MRRYPSCLISCSQPGPDGGTRAAVGRQGSIKPAGVGWIRDRVQVLKYPALAEKNEDYRWRGQPLFPKHKSKEFLLTRKNLMTIGAWEALYQQNPIIVGGGIFPIEKFRTLPVLDRSMIQASVRAIDKAGPRTAAPSPPAF